MTRKRKLTKHEAEAAAYAKIQSALSAFYRHPSVMSADVERLMAMVLLSRKGVRPTITVQG